MKAFLFQRVSQERAGLRFLILLEFIENLSVLLKKMFLMGKNFWKKSAFGKSKHFRIFSLRVNVAIMVFRSFQ